jgi:hypothetical protein
MEETEVDTLLHNMVAEAEVELALLVATVQVLLAELVVLVGVGQTISEEEVVEVLMLPK